MGTNNLTSIGASVVEATGDLFDQYLEALGADFVPRNTGGTVTNNGGNIGTSSVKWVDLNMTGDADIGGDTDVGSNLTVGGYQTLTGSLVVAGASYLNGYTSITSDLAVTGDITHTGNYIDQRAGSTQNFQFVETLSDVQATDPATLTKNFRFSSSIAHFILEVDFQTWVTVGDIYSQKKVFTCNLGGTSITKNYGNLIYRTGQGSMVVEAEGANNGINVFFLTDGNNWRYATARYNFLVSNNITVASA